MSLSSTMETCEARCTCCGHYLKQTEHWFYHNRCTECVHQEYVRKYVKN